MTRDYRDVRGVQEVFVVTNWNSDVTLDCDAIQLSGAAVVSADVLGTLIKVLQEQGILNGTVSA